MAKLTDRVLCGFCFQFVGRFQVRHQRQVHVQHVFATVVLGELPNRFQERQAFDVANGPADFGDHDIDIVATHSLDRRFDFVGDVWDDLNGFAQELALAFFFDHGQIDLAGRVVAVAGQRATGEPFVVAQVQIGLRTIIQDVDFAVLVGAHCARIHIDVGIQLLHPYREPTPLKQHSKRSGRQAFSKRANNAAGYKDVFRHGAESYRTDRFAKAMMQIRRRFIALKVFGCEPQVETAKLLPQNWI